VVNKTFSKQFKLTVKSKGDLPPDTILGLPKTKINPTEIKEGINKFKSLKNGRVLKETNIIEELEALEKDINAKRKGKLEIYAHELRNPRLVINNIPEEISIGNVEDALLAPNTDVNLKEGDSSKIQLQNEETQGIWKWK